VFAYVGGKQDWLSFNLPHEGEALLASDALSEPAATCRLDESIDDVRERVRGAGRRPVVVLNEHDIVIARLGKRALDSPADALAGDVLIEGPTTVRPSEDLEELLHRMKHARVAEVLVTSPEGRLFGTIQRAPAEELLSNARAAGAPDAINSPTESRTSTALPRARRR
jgi:hypothetical protein